MMSKNATGESAGFDKWKSILDLIAIGVPIAEVARRHKISRQAIYTRLSKEKGEGLDTPANDPAAKDKSA